MRNYVIHIIGLEGCGHHGIENIIYQPLNILYQEKFKGSTDQYKSGIVNKLKKIYAMILDYC